MSASAYSGNVYVVVRIDSTTRRESSFSTVSAWLSQEEAENEVVRLNQLQEERLTRYYAERPEARHLGFPKYVWQATRLRHARQDRATTT